jgi:hypothetical protein
MRPSSDETMFRRGQVQMMPGSDEWDYQMSSRLLTCALSDLRENPQNQPVDVVLKTRLATVKGLQAPSGFGCHPLEVDECEPDVALAAWHVYPGINRRIRPILRLHPRRHPCHPRRWDPSRLVVAHGYPQTQEVVSSALARRPHP